MTAFKLNITHGLIAATVAALSACGGGGGGGGGGVATNGAATTVTGVAATGLAIANGSVTLRCTVGATNPVQTASDGSYSVDVSGLTLPCVARVAYQDSSTNTLKYLHSPVSAAGTVNITPVTDMVVANLSSSGIAADVYNQLNTTQLSSFSKDHISTSTAKVKTYLHDTLHVDTSKLPDDVIGTPLVAATGSRKGDSQDGALDDLKTKLGSNGKVLADAENDESKSQNGQGGVQNTGAFATSTGQKADATAGQTLYTASCSGCHGSNMPAAVNYQRTLSAIAGNKGGMGSLSATINTAAADNIATYLAYGTSPVANGTSPVALTAQTITFTTPGNQTMGTAPQQLTASSTSGLPVTLAATTPSVCTITGTALTLMSAGTCTLTATQAGNASFAAATVVTNSFAIAAASAPVPTAQTISFATLPDQTMGVAPATLVATSSSGLMVTLASTTPAVCSVSGTTLSLLAAGTCTVTASQSGSSTVAAAATASSTFVVAPALATSNAANGKTLYLGLCSGCHGITPGKNLSRNILNAANAPSVISNAITKNIGNMGYLANPGYTPQQLADMAAYLATPGL